MEFQIEDVTALAEAIRAGKIDAGVAPFAAKYGAAMQVGGDLPSITCLLLASAGHRPEAVRLACHLLETAPPRTSLCHCAYTLFVNVPEEAAALTAALASHVRRHPAEEDGYLFLLRMLAAAGRSDLLRQFIALGQRHIAGGIMNWQPGAAPHWDALNIGEAKRQKYLTTRTAAWLKQNENATPDESAATLPPAEAIVATRDASTIGLSGAVLVGDVAGGTWWFEYGSSPDALTFRTPARPAPGYLSAHRVMRAGDEPDYWRTYACETDWSDRLGTYVFRTPFGKDPNHATGAGFLDLLGGVYPLHMPERPLSAWNLTDLTGSRLEVDIVPIGVRSKGFQFVAGIQTSHRPDGGAVSETIATWGLTGQAVDLDLLPDGVATTLTFELTADPTQWTYFGNNPDQLPQTLEGYRYLPLDHTLSHHDDNIFFTGMFGDWRDTFDGAIAIPEVRLRFAGKSILADPKRAELTDHPPGVSWAQLCAERTGGDSTGWWATSAVSAGPASGTFRWRFKAPERLRQVIVRNHRHLPAASVVLTVELSSGDVRAFRHDFRPGAANATPASPHYFAANVEDDAVGMTIEVLGMAGAAGFGIDSVEAYGERPAIRPSTRPVTVCTEITGLTPGADVFYRLVREDAGTTTAGETRLVTLPQDSKPHLYDVSLKTNAKGRTVFLVRGNAMGRMTALNWDLDGGAQAGAVDFGREQTSAHRAITFAKLTPGRTYRLRLWLSSDAGDSARHDGEFTAGNL